MPLFLVTGVGDAVSAAAAAAVSMNRERHVIRARNQIGSLTDPENKTIHSEVFTRTARAGEGREVMEESARERASELSDPFRSRTLSSCRAARGSP